MKRRISLAQIVAYNNPHGTVRVLEQFGIARPKNRAQAIAALNHIQKKHGEKAVLAIAKEHPDTELILRANEDSSDFCASCEQYGMDGKKSGCGCGCKGCGGQTHSSIEGEKQVGTTVDQVKTMIDQNKEIQQVKAEFNELRKSQDLRKQIFSELKQNAALIGLLAVGGYLLLKPKG